MSETARERTEPNVPADASHGPLRRPRRRRRILAILLLASLAGLASAPIWAPPLLQRYALLFRVNDPEPSDAVCILLGGFHVRPMRAAELYLRGYAPKILIVDYPDDIFYGSMESQLALIVARRCGVPDRDLVRVTSPVTSTAEEARLYREYAEKNGLKSLLIVTTAFHTRRARWIFDRVFAGSGIRLSYAAAFDPHVNERNWYTSDEGLVTYFSETVKTLYYYLRY
ncbi:hypothetical protein GC170_19740 [bacterium]|nr:hypothetical protein [bacterium]